MTSQSDIAAETRTETVEIAAPGATLVATLHVPPVPVAACVVNGATGVPARFYDAFATWLASAHGVMTLTWDYRDFGRSASGPVRRSRATMTDWGVRDQQAARDWLTGRCGALPLWVVGHSLGGMMLPFQTGLARIDRVVNVAVGAVHLTDHPWPYRALATSFWWGHGAALHLLTGHLPGRLSGMPEDIPGGVFRQWRRWCNRRGFHAADPDLPVADAAALTADMRVVAIADDALAPPAAVWRLMRAYPQAAKRQHLLRPGVSGPIGHVAVFRRRHAAHWPALIGVAAPSGTLPGTPRPA